MHWRLALCWERHVGNSRAALLFQTVHVLGSYTKHTHILIDFKGHLHLIVLNAADDQGFVKGEVTLYARLLHHLLGLEGLLDVVILAAE